MIAGAKQNDQVLTEWRVGTDLFVITQGGREGTNVALKTF